MQVQNLLQLIPKPSDIALTSLQLEMEGYSLVVRDMAPSDAANYTCYAVNRAGLLVVPLQLQVFGELITALKP